MTVTKKRALASLERAWVQHFKSGSLRAKHGGSRVHDAMEAAFRAGATDSEIDRIIDRAGERTARHRGEQYRKYSATGGERRDPVAFGGSYTSAFSKSPSKPAKKKSARQSLSRAETKARHAQKAATYLSKGRLAEEAGEDSTAAIWYLKGSQEYAKAGSKTRATLWYRRGKELQYPEKAREMGTLYRGPYPKRHAQPKRSTHGKSVYKLKYKNVRRDPKSESQGPRVGSRWIAERAQDRTDAIVWTVRGVTPLGAYITSPESRSPGHLVSPTQFFREYVPFRTRAPQRDRSKKTKKGNTALDSRIAINREYTGHASGKPQYVVRFMGDWIGSASTKARAVQLAKAWEEDR